MKSILDILPRPWPTVEILDLGALPIGELPPYSRLVELGVAHVIGFEPVGDACAQLNRAYGGTHRFYPTFIGDGRVRTFHETTVPMTSSLYEPDRALCEPFQSLAELMEVRSRTEVQTTRLDDLSDLPTVDYVKMDIQGAELDAVQGGPRTFAGALVIESEVEFVPIYREQPLFADVDAALRGLGFLFHRFRGISGRTLKPMLIGGDPSRALSQQLWADAVYLPRLDRFESLSPERLCKLAIVLHEIYHSCDFAHHALAHHDRKTGGALAPAYLRALGAA